MKNLNFRYIDESEYEAWDEFVDKSDQGNIFNKSYWLNTVSDSFKIMVCEEDGKFLGGIALPSKYNKYFRNPKLTPQLGILLATPSEDTKYASVVTNQMEIINGLIENLPKYNLFNYTFNYNFTNFYPFIWKDFNVNVKYTYVIEDISNIDEVYGNFQYYVRRSIKKAEKNNLRISTEYGIKDFYDINKKTFDRQKMDMPYSYEFIEKLDKVLEERNNRKIFFAINESNEVIAALYLAYDNNCAFYLMGGADPSYRDTGVQSLLLWESIKFASTVSKRYDFEGSMIKSIESFFRQFGGKQKMLFNVYKSNPVVHVMYKLAMKNKEIVKRLLKV